MSDVARTTGRGFLVIAGAKLWFMVTGAVVALGLPTVFDMTEANGEASFGIYGIVTNWVSIFNMVMIGGTLQAVSKLVSEVPGRAPGVARQAIRVQLWIGVPIAVLYVLLSPSMAGFLNDDGLTPYLRLSGGIILMYAFYAIFVGYLNGRKLFTYQATLDIVFATLKTVLILAAVFLGLGVMGAIGGFVTTSVILCGLAGAWVWRIVAKSEHQALEPDERKALRKRLLGYMIAVMAYTLVLNGIIRADLLILKAQAGATDLGLLPADAAAEFSNRLAGVYTAMANVARLPYQAVIAITFVIFPVISQATFEGDKDATKRYIRQTLRYSSLLVAGMVVALIAEREALVSALYPGVYAHGASALLWLGLAMLAFAFMFVSTTMLIGAARPMESLAIASFTLAAAVGANLLALRELEPGWDMLVNAAMATAIATTAGAIAAAGVLWRRYQAIMPWKTAVRIVLASLIVVGLASFVPLGAVVADVGRLIGLGVVGGKMAVLAILFYAIMYAFGEFGAEDRARLSSVVSRKKRVKEDTE